MTRQPDFRGPLERAAQHACDVLVTRGAKAASELLDHYVRELVIDAEDLPHVCARVDQLLGARN